MFLLYTISKLSRSCKFVKTEKPNPFANDNLYFVLDKDEIDMIINHEHEHWWSSSLKLSRNAVSDMYAYISYENKEFSLQILSTILQGLQKAPFD